MISNLIKYCSCIILLFLSGCHLKTATTGIEDALSRAGDNREELFKVIQHYQEGKDSLKLKAALFLVENMSDKYYLTGKGIDEYYTFIDSVYQIKQEQYDIPTIYESFQNQAKHLKDRPTVNLDVKTLSADYLINNIEEAFAVWNKPWNKHLDFEDFCELVLPYRIEREIPETWRPLYKERFEQVLQADTIKTAKEACIAVNNELIKLPIHIALTGALPISIRPSTLANIKFGLCGDYANLAIYAMRASGIPVAIEIVPHWGRGNNSHIFNVVYDNNGVSHDFSGAEQNPDEHLIRFKNEIPKVYRKTFGKQKHSLAMLHGNEDIPAFFKNAYLKDVTGNYSFIGAKNISIPLPNKTNQKFVYLCVFDPNGWTPVAWGKITGNEVMFQTVGPNIVYHTALYTDGQMELVGHPFLLDTLGHISYYTPLEETTDYILERKNPKANNLAQIPSLIINGCFQGADNPKFEHAVTFHTITKEPDFKYITVPSENATPVKFIRYLASNKTRGNLAEVEFYTENSNIPLKGKIISDYEPSIYYPQNGADKLFDSDPLSFFHSQDTLCWGGLELEKPTKIANIRFIIRNDDNGIRKGHQYELFYMSQGSWLSLGKQNADTDDQILFKNVPKNALYWLRDYTKGHEERIFEVKNSVVIWH